MAEREREDKIRSLKTMPRAFIEKIMLSLKWLENHLKAEFGHAVSFQYLAYEKTGLVYQLRFSPVMSAEEED